MADELAPVPELGSYLQQRYDAGYDGATLHKGGNWIWSVPLFLDRPDFGDKFVIDLGGSDVRLTDALPTIGGAFIRDAGVKVAILANTKRTAWNRTANDVDVKGGKATSAGASPRLVLRNGRISAGSLNAGVAFGNRCGAVLENVVLHGGRFAWSWHDYADQHVVRNGHFQTAGGSAQPSDAFYLYGVAKGDGVLVHGMKCDGAVGGVSLRECFGAELAGVVTSKVRLERCAGITISAAHQEAGIYESYSPNFEVQNSDVVFVGGTFYPPRQAGRATVEIVDTPSSGMSSNVLMLAPGYRLLSSHAASAKLFIDAASASAAGSVRVDGLTAKTDLAPGRWGGNVTPSTRGTIAWT